jgi:WXG100 family type VII secretion target
MANLHVSYQDMTTQASKLRQTQDRIKSDLDMASREIDGLVSGGFVTDRASVKFQENYVQFTQSAKSTIDALDQIARTLEQTAQTLQQADADIASQMG